MAKMMNSVGVTPKNLHQKWQFGVVIDGFEAGLFTKASLPEFEFDEVKFSPAGAIFDQKVAGRVELIFIYCFLLRICRLFLIWQPLLLLYSILLRIPRLLLRSFHLNHRRLVLILIPVCLRIGFALMNLYIMLIIVIYVTILL